VALELLPFHVTDLPGPCPSFTHTTVAVDCGFAVLRSGVRCGAGNYEFGW
jgi:hypothetical protein